MNLIPWRNKERETSLSELSPLASLRAEMDRLFDSLLREPWGAWDWPLSRRGWSPPIDIGETEQEVIIRAEVPGLKPADLQVTVSGNHLILSGEKKESTEKKGEGFVHTESRFGAFRRAIPLPETVDAENVQAEYADGVLTVRLKKSAALVPKRIEVKVKS